MNDFLTTIHLFLSLFFIASAFPEQRLEESLFGTEKDPRYSGDLFEGDIRINGFGLSQGLGDSFKNTGKWINNIIPYTIASTYTSTENNTIIYGMRQLENQTNNCIRFVPRTTETDYISIEPTPGCSSFIGRIGGAQRLSLQQNGCVWTGTVMHELMHALGIFHEQSRPDRDNFVTINLANILAGRERNFEKYDYSIVNLYNLPYDYKSVMHYPPFAFANNTKVPTITPKDPTVTLGDNYFYTRVTDLDAQAITNLYGCASQTNPTTTTTRSSTTTPTTPTTTTTRSTTTTTTTTTPTTTTTRSTTTTTTTPTTTTTRPTTTTTRRCVRRVRRNVSINKRS